MASVKIYAKSLGLLNPELIHARKRILIFGFEGVPAVEIRPRPSRRREMTPVLLKQRDSEFKTEKFEFVVCDEGFDRWNAQARLLHMKQQITALTGGEEVGKSRDGG